MLKLPEFRFDNDGDVCFDWDYGPRCILSVSITWWGRVYWASLKDTDGQNGKTNILNLPGLAIRELRRIHA